MPIEIRVQTLNRRLAKQLPVLRGPFHRDDAQDLKVLGTISEGAIERDSDAAYLVELKGQTYLIPNAVVYNSGLSRYPQFANKTRIFIP